MLRVGALAGGGIRPINVAANDDQSVDTTNTDEYDFGSVTTTYDGVVIVVHASDAAASTETISQVTIDPSGDAIIADLVADVEQNHVSDKMVATGIFTYRGKLDGDTIRVNCSGNMQTCAITVYSIENLRSLQPLQTQTRATRTTSMSFGAFNTVYNNSVLIVAGTVSDEAPGLSNMDNAITGVLSEDMGYIVGHTLEHDEGADGVPTVTVSATENCSGIGAIFGG